VRRWIARGAPGQHGGSGDGLRVGSPG
jgi:hypothetical protein